MNLHRQLIQGLGKLARRIGLRKPKPLPNYIDQPVLRAAPGNIPIDGYFVITPNFAPVTQNTVPEAVPLGTVTVTGGNGRILQRGIWLREFSWYGGLTFLSPSHRHEPRDEVFASPPVKLAGKVTSTIAFWSRIYGHVLLDELPLLAYLLDTGHFRDFDQILVSPLASRLLDRCRHPDLEALKARLILAQPGHSYASTDFVALRRTGCLMNPSRQELDILTKICSTAPINENAPEPSRIFLQRTGEKRKIRNFSEIQEVLDRYDIEVVQATKMPDPWHLFAKAQLVVGVAGSDLSDSCFMSKESHLVEIHPTDHVYPYNWNVANAMGFNYHGMLEKSDIERGTPLRNGLSPITVDPLRLDKRLSAIVPMLTPRS